MSFSKPHGVFFRFYFSILIVFVETLDRKKFLSWKFPGLGFPPLYNPFGKFLKIENCSQNVRLRERKLSRSIWRMSLETFPISTNPRCYRVTTFIQFRNRKTQFPNSYSVDVDILCYKHAKFILFNSHEKWKSRKLSLEQSMLRPAPVRCTTCHEGIHREARSFQHGYGKTIELNAPTSIEWVK